MKISIRPALIAALTLAILSFSCTDDRSVVHNIIPNDQVLLSGEVWGWYCDVWDLLNNPGHDYRFGTKTGDTARVLIQYASGRTDTVLTDSVSAFRCHVGPGLHQVIVETRYTYPDTCLLYLERDTSVVLDIIYAVTDPNTLAVSMRYTPNADSVVFAGEWEAICRLNDRLIGALAVNRAEPRFDWRRSYFWDPPGLGAVYYDIPLANRRFHILTVAHQVHDILTADTTHQMTPTILQAYPRGQYGCGF